MFMSHIQSVPVCINISFAWNNLDHYLYVIFMTTFTLQWKSLKVAKIPYYRGPVSKVQVSEAWRA